MSEPHPLSIELDSTVPKSFTLCCNRRYPSRTANASAWDGLIAVTFLETQPISCSYQTQANSCQSILRPRTICVTHYPSHYNWQWSIWYQPYSIRCLILSRSSPMRTSKHSNGTAGVCHLKMLLAWPDWYPFPPITASLRVLHIAQSILTNSHICCGLKVGAKALTVALKPACSAPNLSPIGELIHEARGKSQENKACMTDSGARLHCWYMGETPCIRAAKTSLTGIALCTHRHTNNFSFGVSPCSFHNQSQNCLSAPLNYRKWRTKKQHFNLSYIEKEIRLILLQM